MVFNEWHFAQEQDKGQREQHHPSAALQESSNNSPLSQKHGTWTAAQAACTCGDFQGSLQSPRSTEIREARRLEFGIVLLQA